MTPIEVTIEVIDRLIALLKGRSESKQAAFDKVFDPAFQDLLEIHGDYISVLEEAVVQLPGHNRNDGAVLRRSSGVDGEPRPDSEEHVARMAETTEFFAEKRREYEPIRVKLRLLANALREQNLGKPESAYVQSLVHYFPTADPYSPDTQYRSLMEYLESPHADPNTIDRFLQSLIASHKARWSDVCEAYTALKLASFGMKNKATNKRMESNG